MTVKRYKTSKKSPIKTIKSTQHQPNAFLFDDPNSNKISKVQKKIEHLSFSALQKGKKKTALNPRSKGSFIHLLLKRLVQPSTPAITGYPRFLSNLGEYTKQLTAYLKSTYSPFYAINKEQLNYSPEFFDEVIINDIKFQYGIDLLFLSSQQILTAQHPLFSSLSPLEKKENQVAFFVDYKTCSVLPDIAAENHVEQIMTYAVCLKKRYPNLTSITASINYLSIDEREYKARNFYYNIMPEQLIKAESALRGLINEFITNN